MTDRVLIIERERQLRESIGLHLTLEGFSCVGAANDHQALESTKAHRFNLVVMNFGLPEALAMCWTLRSDVLHRRTPILLITTPAHQADALAALEQCADDYVVAPVGMRELVARARALVRRSRMLTMQHPLPGVTTGPSSIVRPPLEIDPARRRVTIDGRLLRLTEYEFQLLYVLATRAGVVFDRQTLLSQIWGTRTFVTTRSVDALVKRLRYRFRTSGHPEYLVTVRGVGYKFTDAPATPVHAWTGAPSPQPAESRIW
jgi:DNA-binding response OmpR family regulator